MAMTTDGGETMAAAPQRASDRTPAPASGAADGYAPGAASLRYSRYALVLFAALNFFNYADRQVVSILAHALQADLALTDAQLGFLMGTAFAVFYAVIGTAMGRIADMVVRTRMIALGLLLWSTTTMLSGAARNFVTLGVMRAGVAVGEASANPCAQSLITQYFPARQRAAAISVYIAGGLLGGAGAMMAGGYLLQHWRDVCGVLPFAGACGLAPWRAVYLCAGLPGVLLALLILLTLREPPRERQRGEGSIVALVLSELGRAVPPFSLIGLWRRGGAREGGRNVALLAALAIVAALLSHVTGDAFQWWSVALGGYAIASWTHALRLRDPAFFAVTFGSPLYRMITAAGALVACVIGAVSMWAVPYAMRTLPLSPTVIGLSMGLAGTMGSGLGVVVGGALTDRWKARDVRAPVWMGIVSLLLPLPAVAVMATTGAPALYIGAYCLFVLLSGLWTGAYTALVHDLVPLEMRGTAIAAFALVLVLVSSGCGPYWVGKVSTMTGSLSAALLSIFALVPPTLLLLILTARRLRAWADAGGRAA